jgi:hypothetical protein
LVNPKINNTTSQLDLLTLQAETKRLQKEFDLQEAVATISMQHIINSVKEQYVEELNEEYFGYANQTIKTIIDHLRTNWCKVMMKERTNAIEAFYHAWVPNMMHIITFGCQLTKLQKKCKTINVIISEEAKTLHFVGQMYKSDYFTKEQMTKYEMLVDKDKTWALTLQHFMQLYAQQKAYGDNRAANSRFNSMANIYDVPSNRTMASTAPGEITTCDLYIKSLEELLAAACEYVTKVPNTPIAPDPMAMLRAELEAQRKQFKLIMKQNSDLLTNMAQTAAATAAAAAAAVAVAAAVETTKVVAAADDAVKVMDSKIKMQRSAPTAAKWHCMLQRIVSPWRPTRTRSQQTGNDRDRGQMIAMPPEIG